MFQNSYQNGTYFDVFDPKASQDKLKLLYRTANVQANNKVFDKDLKTFVMQFLTPNAKMCFPKEEKKDLYLIQQYLVFQIYFFPGLSWNIELVVSDLSKTKRRIILSPSTHKNEIKPFFVKTPCEGYKEGVWNNFVIDLYSYIEAFKGQTYRSLDAIYINGHFKLRRIYTTTSEPLENQGENESQQIKQISFLPKNFYFPMGVAYATKVNKYEGDTISEATYEPTEPSTKNSSFLKSSKVKHMPMVPKPELHKIESFKTEKDIKETKEPRYPQNKKIKDFLANTNGELLNRNRKEEYKSQSQSSSQVITTPAIPKSAKSIDMAAKKKKLIKTQQMPPKARSSLDRANQIVPKNVKNHIKNEVVNDKSATKAKVNPWRTNANVKECGYTDASQIQVSKQQDQRNIETPQTISMFKTKNNLGTKFSETKHPDRKSDYSDSEYIELSQKFTTLTDGKFFKHSQVNNNLHQNIEKEEDQDQIEENIEMQTNSIYSNSNKKEEEEKPKGIEHIREEIIGQFERFTNEQKIENLGRSSLYGFGEKLMRKFMGEIERPYSPPICQKQHTEEQVTERNEDQKQQVELIYDPVLNCYYDHKTHTYYELKN